MTLTSKIIAVQDRDLDLFNYLLHARILTFKHAAALNFDGNIEVAKKRIQKLKAANLILERPRKTGESSVLFLSKQGFECLKLHGKLPEGCDDIASFLKRSQISELTLKHELETLDVKVAFHEAVKKHSHLDLNEFSTWPRLYEFSVGDPQAYQTGVKTIKPDGFIKMHQIDAQGDPWEHLFFLELDRSTEKLDTLAEKAHYYRLFYRSGGMALRVGKQTVDFKDVPFQVLFVCKSEERRDNIAKKLLEMRPPVLTHAMLSTFAEVCADPLGQIWRQPADYQNAEAVPKRSILD